LLTGKSFRKLWSRKENLLSVQTHHRHSLWTCVRSLVFRPLSSLNVNPKFISN
jgi:hypothetical protein